jgi:hypothetical protein
MEVKGCGERGVELTFYRVRGMLVSRRRVLPLTCGERAESPAGHGVLLCPDCAGLHGQKPGKPETDGNDRDSPQYVRLARPGGLRSVVAESLLVKHQ